MTLLTWSPYGAAPMTLTEVEVEIYQALNTTVGISTMADVMADVEAGHTPAALMNSTFLRRYRRALARGETREGAGVRTHPPASEPPFTFGYPDPPAGRTPWLGFVAMVVLAVLGTCVVALVMEAGSH